MVVILTCKPILYMDTTQFRSLTSTISSKRSPEHVEPGRLSTKVQDYTVLYCVLQLETDPLSFEGHFFMEHPGKTKTPILALRNLSPLLPAHQSVVKCLSQLTAEQSVF